MAIASNHRVSIGYTSHIHEVNGIFSALGAMGWEIVVVAYTNEAKHTFDSWRLKTNNDAVNTSRIDYLIGLTRACEEDGRICVYAVKDCIPDTLN